MAIIGAPKTTHTTLECIELEDSLRFYTEVMGLSTLTMAPKAGGALASNGHWVAVLQVPRLTPQPFLNFYTRPVKDRAAVDEAHRRITEVRDRYGIQEIRQPANEDPAKFGVGTYGFYLKDRDGNWWRIEENNGPFGPVVLPSDAEPKGSIVPAGPISYVTLESRHLDRTREFYSDFLGLSVRPGGSGWFLAEGHGGAVRVIVVESGDKALPQEVLNHHGLTLSCDTATIDRLHEQAQAVAGKYGLEILPATSQHGAYSFYLRDQDSNWWEVETWEDGIDPVGRVLHSPIMHGNITQEILASTAAGR